MESSHDTRKRPPCGCICVHEAPYVWRRVHQQSASLRRSLGFTIQQFMQWYHIPKRTYYEQLLSDRGHLAVPSTKPGSYGRMLLEQLETILAAASSSSLSPSPSSQFPSTTKHPTDEERRSIVSRTTKTERIRDDWANCDQHALRPILFLDVTASDEEEVELLVEVLGANGNGGETEEKERLRAQVQSITAVPFRIGDVRRVFYLTADCGDGACLPCDTPVVSPVCGDGTCPHRDASGDQ